MKMREKEAIQIEVRDARFEELLERARPSIEEDVFASDVDVDPGVAASLDRNARARTKKNNLHCEGQQTAHSQQQTEKSFLVCLLCANCCVLLCVIRKWQWG